MDVHNWCNCFPHEKIVLIFLQTEFSSVKRVIVSQSYLINKFLTVTRLLVTQPNWIDPNICVLKVHLNPLLWFVTVMVTHWDAIFRPHAESGVGWPAIFTQLRLTTRNSVRRSENDNFDKKCDRSTRETIKG